MKKIALIVLSITFSLIIVEILLRITGYKPWKNYETNQNIIFEPIKNLGWKSKKGTYTISAGNTNNKSEISIGDKGNRLNQIENIGGNKSKIIFVGGSFTQGWGVNDNQTFVSKIQNKYLNYNVLNFGQGGYGGVQSLILLKDEIKNLKNIKLVVYGFIEHHQYRNVARSSWLESLSRFSSQGYYREPKVPFATLDELGKLKLNKPISYLKLPLREYSAIITLLEKVYMKQSTKSRKKIQQKVTRQIFKDMDELAKNNNSKYLVVILDWIDSGTNKNYKKFLSDEKIMFVDCKIDLNDETLIKGDYHPNEVGHNKYYECINSFLSEKKLLL